MNIKNIISIIISFILIKFLVVKNALAQIELGTIGGLETGYDVDGSSAQDAGDKLDLIFSNVIGFLTILSGLYFFVMFITGGLTWASAGGDSGKVENAKNRMTNGVIGLIIVVASYSIIYIVGMVLGINILDAGSTISGLGPRGASSGPTTP